MKDDRAARQRTIEILRDLLLSSFQYTVKDWMRRYNKCNSAIREDLNIIRNLGFEIEKDMVYRYGIQKSTSSENLKKSLYLTETEFDKIQESVEKGGFTSQDKALVLNKLQNIFDLTRIGAIVYNNTYTKKLNVLLQAEKDKQKVKLINYRSANQRSVSDRIVEAFRIMPKDDTIYAYELASGMVKHFKISRFERIEQLDDDWENEGKHYPSTADVFGYVSKKTKRLYIRFDSAGYQRLIDHFPKTRGYCLICPTDEAIMELECDVNESFNGIRQFLLGQYENVIEIIEPQELIQLLNETVKKIKF